METAAIVFPIIGLLLVLTYSLLVTVKATRAMKERRPYVLSAYETGLLLKGRQVAPMVMLVWAWGLCAVVVALLLSGLL